MYFPNIYQFTFKVAFWESVKLYVQRNYAFIIFYGIQ